MFIISNFASSIILGFIEGLTEFIPVSSSGHLLVTRFALGLGEGNGLAFDAILQSATILAVLVYFWKDLLGILVTFLRWVMRKETGPESRGQLVAIVVGTIPAVILGLLLESHMETWFRSISMVAVAMILGSLLMWFAEKKAKTEASAPSKTQVSMRDSIKIGLYQCLALIPGVSRSGATISGGLISGLERSVATRFSFLLSFPIIAGSGAKKMLELIKSDSLSSIGPDLLVASVVAFLVGLVSIHFLIKYLKNHTMKVFIWYRLAFAVIVLVLIAVYK